MWGGGGEEDSEFLPKKDKWVKNKALKKTFPREKKKVFVCSIHRLNLGSTHNPKCA